MMNDSSIYVWVIFSAASIIFLRFVYFLKKIYSIAKREAMYLLKIVLVYRVYGLLLFKRVAAQGSGSRPIHAAIWNHRSEYISFWICDSFPHAYKFQYKNWIGFSFPHSFSSQDFLPPFLSFCLWCISQLTSNEKEGYLMLSYARKNVAFIIDASFRTARFIRPCHLFSDTLSLLSRERSVSFFFFKLDPDDAHRKQKIKRRRGKKEKGKETN